MAGKTGEASDVKSFINQEIIRQKKKSFQDLEKLSKEELIDRVQALQKHVDQLRNVIAKNAKSELPSVKNKNKKERTFDFNKFKRRRILLRVAYFGWAYFGFASQEDAGKTIESELFAALLRTRLIESRDKSNYHRCGRTDKGVSGFSQVISLDVRTNLTHGQAVYEQEGYLGEGGQGGNTNRKEELEFCSLLNRNLPEDLQVTAWAPCPSLDFSARFDCDRRTYRYFFPRADMDIVRMEDAGQRLLGSHDFRNLCKMDVNNGVTNFIRRIESLKVICSSRESQENGPYDMCQIVIESNAFLWHQIRCIVSVLFLIGSGREEADVLTKLLDVATMPCRPQYSMASELPLNLFDCQYSGVEWIYDESAVEFVLRHFQKIWAQNAIKASMARASLRQLELDSAVSVTAQADFLAPRRKERIYTRLLDLPVCQSLEDKIVTVAKRRKIDMPATNTTTPSNNGEDILSDHPVESLDETEPKK